MKFIFIDSKFRFIIIKKKYEVSMFGGILGSVGNYIFEKVCYELYFL